VVKIIFSEMICFSYLCIFKAHLGVCLSNTRVLTIAICTFQRPDSLRSCLIAVMEQVLDSHSDLRCHVLVIDNDKAESARQCVEEVRESKDRIHVRYVVEESAGVGHARNRAIQETPSGSWLLFFDDDQIPDAGWYDAFDSVIRGDGTKAFSGPVIPTLTNVKVPLWASNLWAWGADRAGKKDGEIMRSSGFGNFLASPLLVQSQAFLVPKTFLGTSGEDTAVTVKLSQDKVPIRFLSAARAFEPVSLNRLTIAWVISRKMAEGKIWARVAKQYPDLAHRLPANIAMQLLKSFVVLVSFRKAPVSKRLVMSAAYLSKCVGLTLGIASPNGFRKSR